MKPRYYYNDYDLNKITLYDLKSLLYVFFYDKAEKLYTMEDTDENKANREILKIAKTLFDETKLYNGQYGKEMPDYEQYYAMNGVIIPSTYSDKMYCYESAFKYLEYCNHPIECSFIKDHVEKVRTYIYAPRVTGEEPEFNKYLQFVVENGLENNPNSELNKLAYEVTHEIEHPEYIITEYTERYGWCLHRLAGFDLDEAKLCLKKEQEQYPEKRLIVDVVESKNCWWNDPFLRN